jgi:hypothetical protein
MNVGVICREIERNGMQNLNWTKSLKGEDRFGDSQIIT